MEDNSENDGTDFQKKIMPWRLMTPDPAADEYRHSYLDSDPQPGQLILVTSLISKVPNLGGNLFKCFLMKFSLRASIFR